MQKFEINAEPRSDMGKGASRRLRRAGKMPAILYGAGKEPMNLQLNHTEMQLHLEHEAFYSHILTLKLGEAGAEKVVLKDLQRHPYKPVLLHADLLRINEEAKLTMRVPIHFLNEEKCHGVRLQGGIASHLMTELEIVCLPKDLPEFIELDVAELRIGTTIHISDMKVPEGVEIAAFVHHGDPTQPVYSVHAPRGATEEEGEGAAAE
jgi:large subunit ribosomal protein L25